ncbi:Arginase/deacetylase [Schizophyllum commune H4-8]|nr:Arginase/deacetylase [Schizophyllum commune H4-8]KAI5889109.1 Arginase/deacetylase [Schizophyllum commune H4-8]
MATARRNVAYVVNKELIQVSSRLPANTNRSLLVHSLVQALGLLKNDSEVSLTSSESSRRTVRVVNPQPASYDALAVYHTREYLDRVLRRHDNSEEGDDEDEKDDLGLEDDCPLFRGLEKYVPLVAGASLTGAQALMKGFADVAIAWDGGRHHAQKARASGFCYVADCVLAILALKKAPPIPLPLPNGGDQMCENDLPPASHPTRKPRVMYLDLDLHFSDGVSHAFHNPNLANAGTSQVLTLSIHHAAPGFFPISPLSDLPPTTSPTAFRLTPPPPRDPYTLSLPLLPGYNNATLARTWPSVESIRDAFLPDYVVLQCGVDALAGDKCGIGGWSLGGEDEDDVDEEAGMDVDGGERLALGSLGWCVDRVVNRWGVKTLLLGGGGYNHPNAARAYAYLTSIALDRPLPLSTPIPDHTFFPAYAPSFILDVPPSTMQDENTDVYLQKVEAAFQSSAEILRQRREAAEAAIA